MAREEALRSEPASTDDAVSLDGFHRVFRACRRVTTGRGQHRAHGGLVEAQARKDDGFHSAAPRSATLTSDTPAAFRKSAKVADAVCGRATITRSHPGPFASSPISA